MKKKWMLVCPMLMMAISGCSKSTNNELEYGRYYAWNGSADEIKITAETSSYRIINISTSTFTTKDYDEKGLKTTEKKYLVRGNCLFTESTTENDDEETHFVYSYDFGKGYLKYLGGTVSQYGSWSYFRFYINESFAKKLGVTIIDEVSK